METGSLSPMSGSLRHWEIDQRAEHTNLCPHLHSNETRQIITSNYIIYQLAITAVGKKSNGREVWSGGDRKTAFLF